MKTLFQATVSEFYRQRAGFFLTVTFLAFGFMKAREHRAIASFLVSDYYGIAILLAIWSAYALMCLTFWNYLWTSIEYTFVYNARLVPAIKRLR